MICRSHEARPRTYSGVEFEVLATDSESMVTKMKYREGNQVPFHSHPNSQSGYVVSGRYRLLTPGSDEILTAGDSYAISADVQHSVEVLEAGEVIDVFAPPRQDYL